MANLQFKQDVIPKNWFTYLFLTLLGLLILLLVLGLDPTSLLYGYVFYLIYQRNLRGHKIFFVLGVINVLGSLLLGDMFSLFIIAVMIGLTYMDYKFIKNFVLSNYNPIIQSQYEAQPVTNPIYAKTGAPVNPIVFDGTSQNTAQQPSTQSNLSTNRTNFCASCGAKITDSETRFCPNCGKPVN